MKVTLFTTMLFLISCTSCSTTDKFETEDCFNLKADPPLLAVAGRILDKGAKFYILELVLPKFPTLHADKIEFDNSDKIIKVECYE